MKIKYFILIISISFLFTQTEQLVYREYTENGSLNALIDDYTGIKFFYFDYYFVHSTIVLFPLYLFYILKMKLTKYSWLKTFLFH